MAFAATFSGPGRSLTTGLATRRFEWLLQGDGQCPLGDVVCWSFTGPYRRASMYSCLREGLESGGIRAGSSCDPRSRLQVADAFLGMDACHYARVRRLGAVPGSVAGGAGHARTGRWG